jgi:hypothetical protein
MATPKTVPVNSPVAVNSTAELGPLNTTGVHVARRRKGAGRTLETPGSTCDLIRLGKLGRPSREIDAKGSVRDPDRQ